MRWWRLEPNSLPLCIIPNQDDNPARPSNILQSFEFLSVQKNVSGPRESLSHVWQLIIASASNLRARYSAEPESNGVQPSKNTARILRPAFCGEVIASIDLFEKHRQRCQSAARLHGSVYRRQSPLGALVAKPPAHLQARRRSQIWVEWKLSSVWISDAR